MLERIFVRMRSSTSRSFFAIAFAIALVCGLAIACATTPGASRLALVVGNGAYPKDAALPHAERDVPAVAERLRSLGWAVTTVVDAPAAELGQALDAFARASANADQRLVYYTGHALQIDGENHLVPVDFDPVARAAEASLIEVEPLVERLTAGGGQLAMLLDASYDNPLAFEFARVISGGRQVRGGLTEIPIEDGIYIAYSTAPGHLTFPSRARHSAFARALLAQLDALADPAWEVGSVMVMVRDQVIEQTGGTQVPWDHSALDAPFPIGVASDG